MNERNHKPVTNEGGIDNLEAVERTVAKYVKSGYDPSPEDYVRNIEFEAQQTPFGDATDPHNEDFKRAKANGYVIYEGDPNNSEDPGCVYLTKEGIDYLDRRHDLSPKARSVIDQVAQVSAKRFFGNENFAEPAEPEVKSNRFELIGSDKLQQNLENLFNNHGLDNIEWSLEEINNVLVFKIKFKGDSRPRIISGSPQVIYDRVSYLLNSNND